MGEDYVMKIADFGLARHTRDMDYYRKTTHVSLITRKGKIDVLGCLETNHICYLIAFCSISRDDFQSNGLQSKRCLIEFTQCRAMCEYYIRRRTV